MSGRRGDTSPGLALFCAACVFACVLMACTGYTHPTRLGIAVGLAVVTVILLWPKRTRPRGEHDLRNFPRD